MTAERSQSVHLSQPLLHICSEKADSCMHPGRKIIHRLPHTDIHMLNKHMLDPEQEPSSRNTITFSSLLDGRKNSGGT